MTIKVIALDFEGTLVSNAISLFPRPGLFDFLEFCRVSFERIVMFTYVDENNLRRFIKILYDEGNVPEWFVNVEYVNWQDRPESINKRYKDLTCIPDSKLAEVIIVDDMEKLFKDEHKQNLVLIESYSHPYTEDDNEFERIKKVLSAKIGISN